MAETGRARVFISGRSQAVRIPLEYRFRSGEVSIRRDAQSGDLILSETAGSWDEVFAALDKAGVPDDFLSDRRQGMPHRFETVCDLPDRYKYGELYPSWQVEICA